ncbi:SurA N-terminal domain-containing protein [Brevibacillus massiliensis]|uniref:SurA N-terminal domain-containing protein n=1 Tax=Brevibacillus massiliensis TaxID=1118054 RepID=UPI0002FBE2CE|nr:SurA N-terminal domain-containing protein [Brevibacillus massiliensis]
MKKFDLSILALAILIIALVLLHMSPLMHKETAAAKVNGTVITEEQLTSELKNLYGKRVLDNIISDTLVKQEAKRQGVTVTDEEVIKEVDSIKAQLGGNFSEFLKMRGMTEQQMKEQMYMLLLANKTYEKAKPGADKSQINSWVDDLKKNADIQILDPAFQK